MVWVWMHDKRTDDYKIILNCVTKLMKNKNEKKMLRKVQIKKTARFSSSPSNQFSQLTMRPNQTLCELWVFTAHPCSN
jgi:hypothetical protein